SFLYHNEQRIYKTGDLARFDANGQIEPLGRIDGQVKIRGFRIELGEIESVLVQHESIQEAVVLVHEVVPGDRRLIAYLVLSQEQPVGVKLWKAHLRESLPAFMVPSAFVVLDTLPLSTNGKVDRKALAEHRDYLMENDAEHVAPRDDVEMRLKEIWEQLLGMSEFGVRDNFFELGGHSLLAVRLQAVVEKEFGSKLPMNSLYQEGTIEQLADMLRNMDSDMQHVSLVPLQLSTSDQPPLYIVHPVFGLVQPYRQLSSLLGDRTVYGLQSKGISDGHAPLNSIEDMAAFYIEEMLSVQPEGPYHIAGWSFGGVIAMEMAIQLQRQGRSVAHLGLLDSVVRDNTSAERIVFDEALIREMFRDGLKQLFGVGLGEEAEPAEIQSLSVEAEVEWLVERARTRGTLQHGLDVQQLVNTYRVFQHNMEANGTYMPSAKVEHLYLYKASEGQTDLQSLIPWSELAATMDVIEVPGNHETMMNMPHVMELAEKLREALERK
ncbi:MAG: thioesterase domain-containing protein, partial [Tumebacillaceae bacterium]